MFTFPPASPRPVTFRGNPKAVEAGPSSLEKRMAHARPIRLNIQDNFSFEQQTHHNQLEREFVEMQAALKSRATNELAKQMESNLRKASRRIRRQELSVANAPTWLADANQKAAEEYEQNMAKRLQALQKVAADALEGSNRASRQKALNHLPELYQILIARFTKPESRSYVEGFLIDDTQTPEHAPKDNLFISQLFALPADIDARTLKKTMNKWQHKGKWAAPKPPAKPLDELDELQPSEEVVLAKENPFHKPGTLFIR